MSEWTDLAVEYADRGSNENAARIAQVGQAVETERIATALERIAEVMEAQAGTQEPVTVENITVINPVTKLEAMSSKEKFIYLKQIQNARTLNEADKILTDLLALLEVSRGINE